MKTRARLARWMAFVCGFIAPLALAAPGDVDPTFGTGGKVMTPIGNSNADAYSVAVQSDGKFVVAGISLDSGNYDVVLVRYNTDGSLDTSFGTGGIVITGIGNSIDHANAVAVQSDGMIVVAGDAFNGSNYDIAVLRFTDTGEFDPSFGTGGKVITPIGSGHDVAQSLVIQNDGGIVVAGYSVVAGNDDFAVVRYTASGALDPTFGTGGIVTTPIGPGDDLAFSMALQTDGSLVVAGASSNGANFDFALVRYTSTGALDAGFGSGGKVTTPIAGSADEAHSIVVQPDGKILVAGFFFAGDYDFALARYTAAGALDTNFGIGGKVRTHISDGQDYAYGMALQSDGKIVLAGYTSDAGDTNFALARYTTIGGMDNTFGTGGIVTTSVGTSSDLARSLVIQGDGKIVVAGLSTDANNIADFALVRYLSVPAGTLDPAYDPNVTGTFVLATAVQPDGKTLIGGFFDTVAGVARSNIARLNADGTLDMAFNPGASGPINCITVQPDGELLVGGSFSTIAGTPRNNIARLNPDGVIDSSFDPNADGSVYCIALKSSGEILLGGGFTSLKPNGAANATTRNRAAQLSHAGALSPNFDVNADNYVFTIAVQDDGMVVLGGDFIFVQPNGAASATPRNRLVRVDPTGVLDPTFDPNADGEVDSILVQPDGKLLVGGDFGSFQPNGAPSPTTRHRFARLNVNGTLDATFDPDLDDAIRTASLQVDGKVLIGGRFTNVGGTARHHVARINADGTLDTVFDPDADDQVEAVIPQLDGTVLIGGAFTTLSSTARNLFARVANDPAPATLSVPDTTHVRWLRGGSAPEIFNVTLERSTDNGSTWQQLSPPVRIVGGWEASGLNLDQSQGLVRVAGQTSGGYVNGSAGLIEQTASYDFVTLPATLSLVTSVRYQGRHMRVNFDLPEAAMPGSVKLIFDNGTTQATLTLAASFETQGSHSLDFNPDNPIASGSFASAPPIPDGSYVVTLSYRDATGHQVATSQGYSGVTIGSATAPGTLDTAFNPQVTKTGGSVQIAATLVQPDGKTIIAGQFSSVGGTPRKNLARLKTDGTLDMSFDPGNAIGDVLCAALQLDGSILVNVTSAQAVRRVTSNGSLDANFQITSDNSIQCLAVQPDGKIVVGGIFTAIDGQSRKNIARINPDGSFDASFDAGNSIDSNVESVAVQPDGRIVAGGLFAKHVVRLNTDGSLDTNFDPGTGADNDVTCVALQPDGKIVLGGFFQHIDGATHNRLARLQANGSVDATFTPSLDAAALSVALQADGRILAAGFFSSVNGQNYNNVAALLPDGTLVNIDNFDIGTGADSTVQSIALRPDGGILVTGAFANFNGTPRTGLALLANDAATQTLSAPDKTKVQWLRSGAAPELANVNFDLSFDGVTWIELGAGTLIAGGWQLTGLNLDGLHATVRAVGHVGNSQGTASSQILVQTATFDFDTFTRTPTLTKPEQNSLTHRAVTVDFSLPEPAKPGSVTLNFDNGLSTSVTLTLAAAEEGFGSHTFMFNPAQPDDSTAAGAIANASGAIPDGTYTVTLSYQDTANHNAATAVHTIVKLDNVGPSITPNDPFGTPITVYEGFTLPDYTSLFTASDPNGVNGGITQQPTAGGALSMSTHVVLTATDNAGNDGTFEFDIIVRPSQPPHTVPFAKGKAAPGAGVATGLPGDATLASFGVPAIDEDGHLAFLAKWTTPGGTKGSGLFTDTACLGVVGQTYKSFADPLIDGGNVACLATLLGAPKSTASVVLSNAASGGPLEVIARAGNIAPGLDGTTPATNAKFKTFKAVSIAGNGVAIFAQLTGGMGNEKASAASDLGLWIKDGTNPLTLALREGTQTDVGLTTGTRTVKTIVSFAPGAGSAGQGRGWLTQSYGPGALALVLFTDKTQAVITALAGGVLNVLSQTGSIGADNGPDLTDAAFATFGLPATADHYSAAFLAAMEVGPGGVAKADAKGVFATADNSINGDYKTLARVGKPSGIAGSNFSALKDPVVANDRGVAFPATLKGGTIKGLAGTTLWWQASGGDPILFAHAGPPVVGVVPVVNDLPENAQWKSFPSLAIAANRGPIFIGNLVPGKGGVTKANASGVWATDFQGEIRTLFRAGDQIDVGTPGDPALKTVKSFTLLTATVGSLGVTRSFNSHQQVAWLATFKEDKSQAIVTTEVP